MTRVSMIRVPVGTVRVGQHMLWHVDPVSPAEWERVDDVLVSGDRVLVNNGQYAPGELLWIREEQA